MNKQVNNRIEAFANLGKFLSQFQSDNFVKIEGISFNDLFFDPFKMQIERAKEFNGWFTKENVTFSLYNWSQVLTSKNLNKWLSLYHLENTVPKNIAVVMAGNIPLVGFHDFISVLLSGNNIFVKQSSNDQHFLPLIAKYLEKVEPELVGKISFTENTLDNFDAVIATGSNNTARYFEYYFGKHPNIIRQNRNSIAILSGNENKEELIKLGEDIFRYFGLGCRSVSKLFVPKDYNFDKLFEAIYEYKGVINYIKYSNNYDYNKAVYLMSQFKIIENGFLMLKNDSSYSSPIASLFYEYYDNLEELNEKLLQDKERIQCVIGNENSEYLIKFGESQKPQLWDYADGIDTLDFLQKF